MRIKVNDFYDSDALNRVTFKLHFSTRAK